MYGPGQVSDVRDGPKWMPEVRAGRRLTSAPDPLYLPFMTTKPSRTAQGLRVHNRAAVLRLLRDHESLSRSSLAARTGLSPTTMTNVVAELIDSGCVVELAAFEGRARVGRPAIGLGLVSDARFVVGVQVGAGTVSLGLCDLRARVRRANSFDFDLDAPAAEVVHIVAKRVRTLLRRVAGERVLGIGVAAPGPVDAGHRRNVMSVNLGWQDVPFADLLEAATGLPTVVEHNVRAMALAEARYGDARESGSVLYVYVRTGVGAGLVIDGAPFLSGTSGVTELGHLRVVENGRVCACGSRGCLETVVSEPYLLRRVAKAGKRSVLAAELAGGSALLAALTTAEDAGEAFASDVVAELVKHLSTALAAAVNLLNPGMVLLGGLFADGPDSLLARVEKETRASVFPALREGVVVRRSVLGIDAGVVGAAAFALDRFFYRPYED